MQEPGCAGMRKCVIQLDSQRFDFKTDLLGSMEEDKEVHPLADDAGFRHRK